MSAGITVAVVNDYPLDEALRLQAQGQYPAQHTWGISRFEQLGLRVIMPRFRGTGLWPSLRTQMGLLLTQHRFDVLYAACQSETWLLSRLRRWGMFRRPILAVIHHPIKGRLRGGRTYVHGHDLLLCLSRSVSEETRRSFGVSASSCLPVCWGVDLSFYDRQPSWQHPFGTAYFVSAGKANRDHDTLADAAVCTRQQTLIICSSATAPARPDPRWVTVVGDTTGHAMGYERLTSVYRSALAMVIPLQDVSGLAGLTSLLDAIACGLPVIMTKNAYIDIDIEALGFGFWVDPGDVDGLAKAMRRLTETPGLARAMGCRAREFGEHDARYERFADVVAHHCLTLGHAGRAPAEPAS